MPCLQLSWVLSFRKQGTSKNGSASRHGIKAKLHTQATLIAEGFEHPVFVHIDKNAVYVHVQLRCIFAILLDVG